MHILFFINSMSGGGAERVTANLANIWSERGWQVTIVTVAGQETDAYALAARVRRVALSLNGESASPLAAALNNLRRVRALRKCLRQMRPDVAIGIMTTANCLLALAGRQGRAMRLIGSERTHPPQMPLGRVWEAARRTLYGRLDVVTALTEDGRDWLATHTNARALEVIPNPVTFPLAGGSPVLAPDDFLKPERKTLLAVGRLGPEKAFDRLLDAFASLAPDFLDWDLVIVGEGDRRASLEAGAARLGLGGRLIMPGHAGNIADWYGAADAYVLTSLFEGFPNVLVEAMAHGLPVVSVNCDTGPRDIITDGENGLLVAQDDPAALVAALHRVMNSEELRQRLAQSAIQVREQFSPERITAMWEKLFKKRQMPLLKRRQK